MLRVQGNLDSKKSKAMIIIKIHVVDGRCFRTKGFYRI